MKFGFKYAVFKFNSRRYVMVMEFGFPNNAADLGKTGVYLTCTSADSCTLVPWSNNKQEDDATVKVAIGEWHHVALVVVRGATGGTISFFADGKPTGLTENTYVTSSVPPSKLEFGGGNTAGGAQFVGLLDEIKIWSKPLALTDFVREPAGAMFSRDPGSGIISSGLVGYYRFNRGTVNEINPTAAADAAVMSSGTPVVLTPGPVPWEPALVYQIDGVETSQQASSLEIKSVPNGGGGAAIHVVGFNFAPSQWLRCAWGVVQSAAGVAFPAPASATTTAGGCPVVGEAKLGRVDGKGLSAGPFAVGEIPGAPLAVAATRGAGVAASTTLSCVAPATAAVGLHAFGVANPRLLASVPFEVSETALSCDGADDVLTASAQDSAAFAAAFSPGFASTEKGYTMFAWVKPSSASPGTIMSFQSAAPALHREAEIVYDGARFAYYDDNILAASAPLAAAPGEWHYVAVSVTSRGEGMLVVDGAEPVDFSTRSRPSGGALTVCARLAPPAAGAAASATATAATSHFAGEIDEVRVFRRAFTPEDIAEMAFEDDVAGAGAGGAASSASASSLLSLLNFTHGYDAYPPAGFQVSGSPGRVASTGPWRAPEVASLVPSSGVPAGGERVTVSAANLAPSRWLKIDLGAGVDIAPLASDVAGSVAVVTTPPDAGCTPTKSAVGVSSVARGAAEGFERRAEFGLSSSMAGFAAGLEAYVPVDAGTARTTTTTTTSTTTSTSTTTTITSHTASVGDAALVYLEGTSTTDRDGFEGGAAAFGPDSRLAASPALMAAMSAAMSAGHTVMAWVRLDVDATRAKLLRDDEEFAHLAASGDKEGLDERLADELARVGSWNLVAVTAGAVSINGAPSIAEGDVGEVAAQQHAVVLAALGSYLAGVGGGGGGGGGGMGAVGGGFDATGAIDQLWVYDRQLAACEIAARFHVTATAVSTAEGPVPLPLPTPAGGLNMTLSLWIYPNGGGGDGGAAAATPQIIASTADVEGGGSATVELALAGPTVVLGLKKSTCACAPCLPVLELRSSGIGGDGGGGSPRVLPARWAHVAVSLGGGRADIFVDGVLAATAPLPAVPGDIPGGPLGPVSLGTSFDGLVHSAALKRGPSPAYEVKAAAQCAPRSLAAGVARLNEGSGLPLPPPPQTAADADVDANARRWVDASMPTLPTHGASTEIFGKNALAMTTGAPGLYTIVAKTACGARRVTSEPAGRPAFGVTLSRAASGSVAAASVPANVTDLGDGSYGVSVAAGNATGLTCGEWTTSVTLGGVAVKMFTTVISPDAASPAHSYIEGGAEAAEGSPFAAVGSVTVQLMDAYGCPAAGDGDADALGARFEGPHRAAVNVEPLGGGRYKMSFLPESPGTYNLAVTLAGKTIRDAARCVTVSAGAGALFTSSSGGVKVSPPVGTHDYDLTDAGGLAVEAWVKPSAMPTQKASVVYKGGPARSGDNIKGYQISYDVNYVVTASVYVGRSEVRAAVASAKSAGHDVDGWLHLGLIYDGAVVTLTFNGVVAASSVSAADVAAGTTLPPVKSAENPYPADADVTVGFGVDGVVDEVRLWDGGAGDLPTPASIAARRYCTPLKLASLPGTGAGLAAYVAFSERPGAGGGAVDSPVFSAACTPAAYHANAPNATKLAAAGCGVAVGVTRPAAGNAAAAAASTALSRSGPGGMPEWRGAGVASATYSEGSLDAVHTAGLISELRWSAVTRDECGYDYVAAVADVVSLQATSYTTYYIDNAPKPPGANSQLPDAEMPVTVQGATLSPPNALAVSGACAVMGPDPVGGAAALGVDVDNLYRGTLDAVNVAGTYTAQILVGGLPIATTYPLTVESGVPKEFTVIGAKVVEITAGVTAWTRLRLLDSYGNALTTRAEVGAEFKPASKETPWRSLEYAVVPTGASFDALRGIYTVSFVLPEGPAVEKTVQTVIWGGTFTLPGVVAQEVEYIVSAPKWRQVTAAVPPSAADDPLRGPGARFEHAAAVVGGEDLIVFGGAAADKTYLSDAWRLPSVHLDAFAYSKRVKLVSTGGGVYVVPAGGAVVEVIVDTAELIQANRMGSACLDVQFAPPGELSPSGSLPFYLDPHPGCNATRTSYLVRVPAGPLAPIDMYYGDPNFGVVQRNVKNDPDAVFDFYDGFEGGADGDAPDGDKWDASCAGNSGFRRSSELAYAGAGALYAPKGARGILSGIAAAGQTMPESYRLRAWFWDSGAAATSHALSPGYAGACPAGGAAATSDGGDVAPGLPGTGAVAVGAYSRCHRTDFCVASPWVSGSGAPRSARWHRLEVESRAAPQFSGSSQSLRVTVDGVLLKAGLPSPLTAPLITAGVGVVGGGGHAFWDEVSVLALAPIYAQVSAMSGDVLVAANARAWTKIELQGPPPPPRYGHSLVAHGDDVIAYGGERSSFVLGEVWTLRFGNGSGGGNGGGGDSGNSGNSGGNNRATWVYAAPPAGAPQPTPRYDHAAVTLDGVGMVVLGGRGNGGAPTGDVWSWDPSKSRWTSHPEMTLDPPRFGHAAAALGGALWVFGGYTGDASNPFTRQLLKCTPGVGCVDAASTCPPGFAYDPPVSLTPRYLSSLHGDGEFLYVYGGSNIDAPDGFGAVYKYEPASCTWRELSADGPAQGRYEHASAVAGGRMMVVGGHAAGVPQPDVYMFPLY